MGVSQPCNLGTPGGRIAKLINRVWVCKGDRLQFGLIFSTFMDVFGKRIKIYTGLARSHN